MGETPWWESERTPRPDETPFVLYRRAWCPEESPVIPRSTACHHFALTETPVRALRHSLSPQPSVLVRRSERCLPAKWLTSVQSTCTAWRVASTRERDGPLTRKFVDRRSTVSRHLGSFPGPSRQRDPSGPHIRRCSMDLNRTINPVLRVVNLSHQLHQSSKQTAGVAGCITRSSALRTRDPTRI